MKLNKHIFTQECPCPSSAHCGGCNSCQGTTSPHVSDFADCGNCLDHGSALRYENDNKVFVCEY
jgi:hypothetical protein